MVPIDRSSYMVWPALIYDPDPHIWSRKRGGGASREVIGIAPMTIARTRCGADT